MGQIDLRDYAISESKIPKKILIHQGHVSSSVGIGKILLSYFVDVYIVLSATIASITLMEISTSNLMMTDSLSSAHASISSGPMEAILFPVILTGYFFFSYFFNQGQTWGNHLFKFRVEVPDLSFKESFRWTMFSVLLIYSLGLIGVWARKWKKNNGINFFMKHDYLYTSLVSDKVIYPVNLIAHITTDEVKPDFTEHKEAA